MKRIKNLWDDKKLRLLVLLALVLVWLLITIFIQSFQKVAVAPERANHSEQSKTIKPTPKEPTLDTDALAEGLDHPWDIVTLPSGTIIFNERSGAVSKLNGNNKQLISQISDVYAIGEGGLTGMALDVNFPQNRNIYTCLNSRNNGNVDVRLVRWKLSDDESNLLNRKDIITGIPSNRSGRHSGCRVRVAKDGTIWVGTGDAAVASNPQDPTSLGGKILRVDREGKPISGNLKAPFDERIFSFGHRNVQGLILFESPQDNVYGFSVEHGSDRDDEINLLKSGNFGWAPTTSYVEAGVSMTDKTRFPDAISAVWSSGLPTIAPSGAVRLSGEAWGTWDNALAMAVLKGRHIRVIGFDDKYQIEFEKEIAQNFGRIRSTSLAPDGTLLFSTDNGVNDKIIRMNPSQ